MYVEPAADLKTIGINGQKNGVYLIFAERGYWDDAIDNLNHQVDLKPDNTLFRNHRIALLKPGVLPWVAEFDQKGLSLPRRSKTT